MKNKTILILVVIGNLDVGGAERHLIHVLPRIKAHGFDVLVYTTNSRGKLAAEMEQRGVSVLAPPCAEFLLKLGKIAKPLVYALSLIKLTVIMRRRQPELVHFYLPGAYLLGGVSAILARCKKRIMSRRIVYTDEYRKSWFFKAEKYLHKGLSFALACSKEIEKELIQEGIPQEKLGIIYNGVDLARASLGFDKKRVRKDLGIAEDTLMILIVANLYKRKGHIDLLNALALIQHEMPRDWQLFVVGRDGGERAFLEKMVKTLGLQPQVCFMGQQLQVEPFMQAADFGVLCSHEEGFSNALLESLLYGLPMVVTNVSGSNEAVQHGENGWLVPVSDPPALARGILTLAQDSALRAKMSSCATARVMKYFTLDKVVEDYVACYSKLLDRTPLGVTARM